MRIPQLPELSAPTSSHLFAVSSSTNDYKIDYNKLAKALIEQYAGSTLGGSARSVKAALDAINDYPAAYAIPYQSATINFATANEYYQIGASGLTVPAGKYLVFGNFQSNHTAGTSHQEIVMISDSDSGGAARKNTMRYIGDTSTTAHYANVMWLGTFTQQTTLYGYVASTSAGISSILYLFLNAIRVH